MRRRLYIFISLVIVPLASCKGVKSLLGISSEGRSNSDTQTAPLPKPDRPPISPGVGKTIVFDLLSTAIKQIQKSDDGLKQLTKLYYDLGSYPRTYNIELKIPPTNNCGNELYLLPLDSNPDTAKVQDCVKELMPSLSATQVSDELYTFSPMEFLRYNLFLLLDPNFAYTDTELGHLSFPKGTTIDAAKGILISDALEALKATPMARVAIIPTAHFMNGQPACYSSSIRVSELKDPIKYEVIDLARSNDGPPDRENFGMPIGRSYIKFSDAEPKEQFYFSLELIAANFLNPKSAHIQFSMMPAFRELPKIDQLGENSFQPSCFGPGPCAILRGPDVSNLADCPVYKMLDN